MGLYRGKRKDNGEWVEGWLVIRESPKAYYIVTSTIGVNKNIAVNNMLATAYEVDPETIGEYSGLPDKNGIRVFEGDILKFENDDGEFSLYLCEWGGEICGWIIRFLEYDAPCDVLDAHFCMDAQVIGNIHDNPELLEVSGDE